MKYRILEIDDGNQKTYYPQHLLFGQWTYYYEHWAKIQYPYRKFTELYITDRIKFKDADRRIMYVSPTTRVMTKTISVK